jgi:dual specificity tyrosine-phosphorylation-regulated kinase 2/3/4
MFSNNSTVTSSTNKNVTSKNEPKEPGPRGVTRSNSLLRRPSDAKRSHAASDTNSMPPPNAPLSVRTRRQSQFPAPTQAPASTNLAARSPRKSLGPGVLAGGLDSSKNNAHVTTSTPSEATRSLLGRTPSLGKSNRRETLGQNLGSGNDVPRFSASSRSAKAKSMQPPARISSGNLTASSSTPDPSIGASIAHARSPGKSPGQRNHTPSSGGSKRQSIMPPQASGLGARTVSPTDVRRLKRMSMLPNPPTLSVDPQASQPDTIGDSRSLTYSPAAMFRKSVTPSSARGTPIDNNRKSYGSGFSLSSTSSFSSLRAGTHPIPRAGPFTSSRLPTPKPSRNLHSSAGGDEEEVPPVPAIPKAYESPKETADQSMFPFGKVEQQLGEATPETVELLESGPSTEDVNSLHNYSASETPMVAKKPNGNQRHRRGLTVGAAEAEKPQVVPQVNKRNLQPLRLPPLNLLPLSTPTASKIASFPPPSLEKDSRAVTPPPKRSYAKTPSTPMTASKATFFSKSLNQDGDANVVRSSSSHYNLRSDTSTLPSYPSTAAVPIPTSQASRSAMTPFASASLPKGSGEFYLRSRPSGEYSKFGIDGESEAEISLAKPTGPRAQPLSKKDTSSTHTSTSDEPETPSSGSSLRRKLSLGWKRSSSKASHISQVSQTGAAAHQHADSQTPQQARINEMPPPRFPASAVSGVQNGASPTPVKYRGSLDQRRRNPSSNFMSDTEASKPFSARHRRNGSANVPNQPDSNDQQRPQLAQRSTSSILTPVQRMLGAKSSVSALKARNLDTNLDKDDLAADEEMKKLAARRKDFETAAKEVDELRKRAKPQERVSPSSAIRMAGLNIFERGEVIDYTEVYFCGTKSAKKHVGDLNAQSANFGYDDDRGDYNIVLGDHLAYRYEVVDVLGKGSFGQVVRCIDHKTGALVAVKIIRNKKRFHQQALVEVNILQKLREWVSKYRPKGTMQANRLFRIPITDTA